MPDFALKQQATFKFDKKRDLWVCSIHGETDYAGWVPCWNGCDDGYFDEYEDDPINYAPGEEFAVCDVCHGKGGWNVCPECAKDNPDVEW